MLAAVSWRPAQPFWLLQGLQPMHIDSAHTKCSDSSIYSQTAELLQLRKLVRFAVEHTRVPDLAVMKLSAEVLDACPKLLALTKLSTRPGGSKTGSSLSPAALCTTLRALVKDPALQMCSLWDYCSSRDQEELHCEQRQVPCVHCRELSRTCRSSLRSEG